MAARTSRSVLAAAVEFPTLFSKSSSSLSLVASVFHLALAVSVAATEMTRTIEFNRDVRPILADHCFACHGPDARQRKADLRLDTPETGNPQREGGPVVVARHPEKSELWRRINSTDPDEQMPPLTIGRRLNESEVSIL